MKKKSERIELLDEETKRRYDELVQRYRKQHPGSLVIKEIKFVRVDENGKDIKE